jgi:hypothetical protein
MVKKTYAGGYLAAAIAIQTDFYIYVSFKGTAVYMGFADSFQLHLRPSSWVLVLACKS